MKKAGAQAECHDRPRSHRKLRIYIISDILFLFINTYENFTKKKLANYL